MAGEVGHAPYGLDASGVPLPDPTKQPDAPPDFGLLVQGLFGAIGQALDVPRGLVQGTLGAGVGALDVATKGIQPAPGEGVNTSITGGGQARIDEQRALAERLAAAPPEQRDAIAREHMGGVPSFVLDTMTNPINYIGLGVPGAALHALPVLGSTARVAQAAHWLDLADKAVAEAPWKAVSGATKGVLGTLGKIPLPDAVKVTTEGGGKVAAETLGGLLGAPSASSRYKEHVRTLIDMVNNLTGQGRRLERDAMEQGKFFSVPQAARDAGANDRTLGALQKDFLHEVASVKDPQAQVHALEVLDRVEQGVDSGFRRIAALQQQRGTVPQVQDIYSEMFRTIAAGRAVVDRAASQTRDTIDPALATHIGTTFDQTIQRIMGHIQTGGQLPAMGVPAWRAQSGTTSDIRQSINNFRAAVGGHPLNAGPSGGPAIDLQHIGNELGGNLAGAMQQAAAGQKGLPAVVGLLPERFSTEAPKIAHQLTEKLGGLITARQQIGTALEDVWRHARPGQPLPVQLPQEWSRIDNPQDVYTSINQLLNALGEQPIQQVVDLFHRPTFMSNVEPRALTRLEEAIKRYPQGDLIADDPYKIVIDSISRDYAKQYGIGERGVFSAVKAGTALYKEAQLHSLSYGITNTLGALAAAGVEGISPLQSVRHLSENWGDAIHGRQVVNSDMRNIIDATGIQVPHGVTSAAGILADQNATRDFAGAGTFQSAKLGPLKLGTAGGAIGAIAGGLTPAEKPEERAGNIAKGVVEGSAYGVAFPVISKMYLGRIVGGMEATVRQDAFSQAFMHGVAGRTDQLLGMVRGALGETTRVATDSLTTAGPRQVVGLSLPVSTQRGTASDVETALQNFVEGRGGLVSPEWLQKTLTDAGVRPDAAGGVARTWRTLLDQASHEGEAFAGRIHVDYEHLNNFEEFMRTAAPFSTWAMKMTPFWAEHILTRPAVLFSLIGLEHAWEQDRLRRGLPPRFMGSTEVGPASFIASVLLGRPVQLYFNPLRGFVPFSDTERLAAGAASAENDNPFATAYKEVSSFGVGAHPLVDYALRVGGAFGNDEPARGYLRVAGPLQPLSGVDLNRAFIGGETAVRGALHGGQQPTDMETLATQRRLDELAVQQLGHPPMSGDADSIPFLQAKVAQKGPLWEQARRDAQANLATRTVPGFFSQVTQPQAVLTPEEAAIRIARTPMQQGGSHVTMDPKVAQQLQQLLIDAGPTAQTPPALAQTVKDAATALWSDQVPDIIKFYLDDGRVGPVNTARSLISQAQIMSNPLAAGYTGGGSPEETRLDELLAAYNNPGALVSSLSPAAQRKLTEAYTIYAQAPPAFQSKLIGDKTPSGYWLQQAVNARDAFKSANPILEQYLDYLKMTQGNGNKTDFLQRYFRRP